MNCAVHDIPPLAVSDTLPMVVIVEDDTNMRELIYRILTDMDIRLFAFESAQEALDFIEENRVAVVITDLKMPRIDGNHVLKFAHQCNAHTQVILVTGFATVDSAVETLKAGAFDYVCKPFENIELQHTVGLALEHWTLCTQNQRLREERDTYTESSVLIGRSPAMEKVFELIEAAAAYDCGVLITGETGTGKEVVARQIHTKSTRRDREFVALNCAAIPENIIESELFGYQKGAFTGADHAKPGLFERANGGTIFLDELNNATLALQAKLLRVLQDGSFFRLGDTVPRSVDVRVIAASNRNIPELIELETFRVDLYYRLRVIEIPLPPLRDRHYDIPLLAQYFMQKFSRLYDKPVRGLSTQVLGALMRYDWPGNVRELDNVIQRMLILSQPGGVIGEDVLPPELKDVTDFSGRALDHLYPQTLEEIEVYFIRKTLRETEGDRALCAEILGIDKSTLWRKIKRYKLDKIGE